MICILNFQFGNVEFALADASLTARARAELGEVQRAAQHSADITRQLLTYARREPVAPTQLDLNDGVRKSLSMLRPLLGEAIEVSWHPGAALWGCVMDPSQLDQVVANLCVNARDAIGGVGHLTLCTSNVTLDEAMSARHVDALPGLGCRPCMAR